MLCNSIQPRALLFTLMALLYMADVFAAAAPLAPLPVPDGPVNDVYVNQGRVYLTGNFSAVAGSPVGNGLAAIDVASGTLVSAWTPSLGDGAGGAGIGEVLLPSADGKTLYVGGRFATVDGVAHNLVAAINIDAGSAGYGQVSSWDPQLIGTAVLALDLSPAGTIVYAGGDFTAAGSPVLSRSNLAAFDSISAMTLPWAPEPDGLVKAVINAPDGSRVYVAGQFTTIGSSDGRDARSALAAVNPGNAAVQSWDAGVVGTSVNDMVLSSDAASLTIAGQFTAAGGQARANLARLDTTTGAVDPVWVVDSDGPVYALGQNSMGDLFVGGAFTTIQGQTGYNNLALLRADTLAVAPWQPQVGSTSGGAVYSLSIDAGAEQLVVGGDYTDIGGAAGYQYLAAYSIAPPVTVSASTDGFASTMPLTVTLSCTAQSGGVCAATYLTTDGSQPTTVSPIYTAPLLITSTTTLKYFSVDADGNREAVHSETYTIDVAAPQTNLSPAQTILNAGTYTPVELLCDDGVDGSGCAATYYTVDDTTPTNASPVYSQPLELSDGNTTLRYFSVDNAGNAEAVGSRTYTVDRQLPTISVSPDSGNYLPPLDVTLICDDGTGSGCDQIYLTTDGSNPADPADPVTPFTYSGPIKLTLNSAAVLRIVATDVAGNSGASTVGIYTFTDPSPIKRHGSGTVDGGIVVLLAVLLLWRLHQRVNDENGACR